MRTFVLDASAWLRLFLCDGPEVPGLEQAAQEVEAGSAVFVAPEMIVVEAGHALLRKVRRKMIRQADWPALWQDLRRVPITLLAMDDHIDAALELAVRYSLSVYDAQYLAVAVYLGAKLFTADEALAKAARAAGV